jgi:DNA-binding transcriptional LysR family regulator
LVWQHWCDIAGIPFLPAKGTTTLDTDEAAIVACLAGFGVALATSAFVAQLIAGGELQPLCPQIHPVIGVYRAMALSSSPTTLAFMAWLDELEQRGLGDYPGPGPTVAARGQPRSHAASGKPVGRR